MSEHNRLRDYASKGETFKCQSQKFMSLEGRYDERRLGNVSRAVQDALEQHSEDSLG